MVNLVRQQLAYASVVSPQGDIRPVWEKFLQNYVNRESLVEWAQKPDDRRLADDLWPDKPHHWKNIKSFISGLIP